MILNLKSISIKNKENCCKIIIKIALSKYLVLNAIIIVSKPLSIHFTNLENLDPSDKHSLFIAAYSWIIMYLNKANLLMKLLHQSKFDQEIDIILKYRNMHILNCLNKDAAIKKEW